MTLRIKPPGFWYGKEGSFWPLALAPLGKIYGFLSEKRFDLYYPVPMGKPVICVGNLVAGGAGKTPVAMAIVDLLLEKGYNPHILTRGYGGTEEGPMQVAPSRDTAADVGDEALLLVEKAPTWVSKNRALGAQAAIYSGANVIVLDDGFQNATMYKNFSLLVVDGIVGFGNGKVMPAGPLRENISFGLSRADAVVIIGEDKTGAAEFILKHAAIPVLSARLVPDPGNPDVFGKQVFAFAGIGRPEKFRETLEAAGAVVEGWGSYPDHVPYVEEDLDELVKAAEARGMPILTTAKDHVRLPEKFRSSVQKFSVHLEWENAAEMSDLIEKTLAR
jgi:tetraacyldisaccharide 4'-kinase